MGSTLSERRMMASWTKNIIFLICILGSMVDSSQEQTLQTYCLEDQRYYHDKYGNYRSKSVTICSEVNFEDGPLERKNSQEYYDCQYRRSCSRDLKIVSSDIPTLPSSAFINYPDTALLYIRDVQMTKILPAAFNSLDSLKELSLSNNYLTTISDGIFNSLTALKSLDLSKNNIHNLSTHSLVGINLKLLNLSFNDLETFDDDFLTNLNTEELDLSFNKFVEFNFSKIDSVQILNLSNNHIKEFDGCFTNLSILNLSNNKIESYTNVICDDVNSNIYKLDLSYNYLSDLDPASFFGLNNLKYLYLQNNNISFIPHGCFSTLTSLSSLNLSSNNFVIFEYGVFDNMNVLIVLDVSNNKLNTFKKPTYHSLQHLGELYLQQNEISYINAQDVAASLLHLTKINLDGNNFTCESLVEIFYVLKNKVEKGTSVNTSNIHGIPCSEDYATSLNLSDSTNREISQEILNDQFHRSVMYNYFNRDFKNSNFFKYLESLQPTNNGSHSAGMSDFFNKDFRSTNFYRYLEDLSKDRKALSGFSKDLQDYFDKGFRSSNFVSYLDSVKKSEDTFNKDFPQSVMYNYFNKDFENSNFYKFLEALRSPRLLIKYSENGTNTRVEKLVSSSDEENKGNSTFLVMIILLLVLNVCLMALSLFRPYKNRLNGFNNCGQIRNEEVELVEP